MLLLLVSVASVARATYGPYTGRILVGHPATHSPVFAVTDRLAPCDPSSAFNGIDAVWFETPAVDGKRANLTTDTTLDGAVFFWNNSAGSCELIQVFSCATVGRGRPESCTVPAGTTHTTVEGFAGTGAFVLTIT